MVRLCGQHAPVGAAVFQQYDVPTGGGLSLSGLLGKLMAEQQADKPINVLGIAVGPEADAGALQQISQAIDGRTFIAKDPAAAVQTLVLAFAGRLSYWPAYGRRGRQARRLTSPNSCQR